MHWDFDGLRALLQLRPATQLRLLNFLENHDEPRALERLGSERQRAAATLVATLPAALLLHDGQLEGRRIKLPIQIARQPDEAQDAELYAFYERLLRERADAIYHQGEWQLLDATAPLLCYSWRMGRDWRLVALNFAPEAVSALVSAPILGDALVVDSLAERERQAQVTGGLLALELDAYGAEIWVPVNASI